MALIEIYFTVRVLLQLLKDMLGVFYWVQVRYLDNTTIVEECISHWLDYYGLTILFEVDTTDHQVVYMVQVPRQP